MIEKFLMARGAWEQMMEDQKEINEMQEKHKLIEFLEWMSKNGFEVCQLKTFGLRCGWYTIHDMGVNIKFTDMVDRYFDDTEGSR